MALLMFRTFGVIIVSFIVLIMYVLHRKKNGKFIKRKAVKLAEDFGLNYDSRQKPSIRPHIREPTPEHKYQKEENHCYKVLTDYFHLLREWEKKYAPKQPDEEWRRAAKLIPCGFLRQVIPSTKWRNAT
jgi:acyl-CoA synthetase (AMP-forming)/AMP-acid ligase II